MRRTPWSPLLPAVAALSAACASAPAPVAPAPVVSTVRCDGGDTVLVREVLYFGRNRPGGGTVSDADWDGFLDSVVTPRFPAGYTVVEALGHWRGASGAVERERTEVMTLLHPDGAAGRQAVDQVAAEYIRRFGQEAVLRERLPSCARFQSGER